jgi:hypothetical protein
MIQPPFCSDPACGWPTFAPAFWTLFMAVSSLMVVNLVIAIVLDQFETEMALDSTNVYLNASEISTFRRAWLWYHKGRMMPVTKLPALIRSLRLRNSTLVPGNVHSRVDILRLIDSLDLPSDGINVHFVDVLYRLSWLQFVRIRRLQKLPVDPVPVSHEEFCQIIPRLYQLCPELSSLQVALDRARNAQESSGSTALCCQVLRRDSSVLPITCWPVRVVVRVCEVQRVVRGMLERRAVFRDPVNGPRARRIVDKCEPLLPHTFRMLPCNLNYRAVLKMLTVANAFEPSCLQEVMPMQTLKQSGGTTTRMIRTRSSTLFLLRTRPISNSNRR